ncbi:hypothetical protein [Listeria cornellensis]|uniref:Uncharacterized protein n=1 Tax=Listeria cornellensis FSL F6-0969 TaxID=1265820 RepID=W7C1L1_9LIST|nr:hypothetical protein [Listeria cornellensis]EUJ26458.1 hypothetical protein PCORN_14849 [Listeria cornellensis FSL F6-0969]
MQTNKIGKIVLVPLLATTLVAAPLLSPISAIANEISTSEETPLPVLTLDEATSGNTPDEFLVRDTSSTPSSPMLRSAMLGYEKWTLKSQVKQKTNTFIGWHPDFKAYKYNVAFYYFSSTQHSTLSVSLGYGPISLSVDKNKSSGYAVPSNIKKMD